MCWGTPRGHLCTRGTSATRPCAARRQPGTCVRRPRGAGRLRDREGRGERAGLQAARGRQRPGAAGGERADRAVGWGRDAAAAGLLPGAVRLMRMSSRGRASSGHLSRSSSEHRPAAVCLFSVGGQTMRLSPPACPHCGRPLALPPGAHVAGRYCNMCRPERLRTAQERLEAGPVSPAAREARYQLPRRTRNELRDD